MQVKFKRKSEDAVLPRYANPGDAGLDVVGTSMEVVNTSEYGYIEYGTGWAVEIPEGFCGLLFPRSSVSKTGLILANSIGLIDCTYRGELKFRYKYIPGTAHYSVGDKVGQLVIMPLPTIEPIEQEELTETVRGEGGFGSTGT